MILINSEPSVETATEAVRADAFDFVAKPIDKAKLLRTLANAARFKALDEERRRLAEENEQRPRASGSSGDGRVGSVVLAGLVCPRKFAS